MHTSQHHWFTLTIQHPYFKDGLCSVFQLIPLGETQCLMKNYTIRFRKHYNEYYGYLGIQPHKNIWEELPAEEDLFFQLVSTDLYFNNYTELPEQRSKEDVLYVSNTEVVNRSHQEESVVPETFLKIQGLRFGVEVSPEKPTTIVIKNAEGQQVFTANTQKKQRSVAVDITSYGTGVYQLWINETLSKTFFGTSEQIEPRCYGIIHLKMRYILESLKENTLPGLSIHFDAKSTYWQYLIIAPSNKKINIQEMTIISKNDEYNMDAETKIISGSNEATVFTSKNQIQLCQHTEDHSVLNIRYNNHFSDIVEDMDIKIPVPNPSSLTIKKENNKEVYYSPTIIYV